MKTVTTYTRITFQVPPDYVVTGEEFVDIPQNVVLRAGDHTPVALGSYAHTTEEVVDDVDEE